jgi:hypothetical protein
MCLPVSRLFWVSSLAYPNLLGTKGYVVVVVVDICTMSRGFALPFWLGTKDWAAQALAPPVSTQGYTFMSSSMTVDRFYYLNTTNTLFVQHVN